MFETLRKFYRTDRIRFTFVSDEFNGVTRDNQGNRATAHAAQLSILCQKPKRKTARVESISAYTGRSTRAKGSPKAGMWRITCLPTSLRRCTRQTIDLQKNSRR